MKNLTMADASMLLKKSGRLAVVERDGFLIVANAHLLIKVDAGRVPPLLMRGSLLEHDIPRRDDGWWGSRSDKLTSIYFDALPGERMKRLELGGSVVTLGHKPGAMSVPLIATARFWTMVDFQYYQMLVRLGFSIHADANELASRDSALLLVQQNETRGALMPQRSDETMFGESWRRDDCGI